ncbi:MAG: hybD [Phycisphaerales bacterium]|nr:hybD [Phycisphaerales bacterium]
MTPRILIAGIGNIFLGDDAFGVEVARRLLCRPQLPAVRVVDFGIRGLDLAYALLDGYELAILVDAVPQGGAPGTLYVLEPQIEPKSGPASPPPAIEAHSMDPAKVLRTVAALGGRPGRVLVVGCEPSPRADVQEMQFEMSEPVSAAVDEAVSLVESLVRRLLNGESVTPDYGDASFPRPRYAGGGLGRGLVRDAVREATSVGQTTPSLPSPGVPEEGMNSGRRTGDDPFPPQFGGTPNGQEAQAIRPSAPGAQPPANQHVEVRTW